MFTHNMCNNTKTLILCILTLGISLVLSESNAGINESTGVRDIFCQFTGQGWISKKKLYSFNIDDVQNALGRCQCIMFATYFFDRRTEIDTHVIELDKNALRLAECGKTIYIGISFADYSRWAEVFIPEDDELLNYHVTTLISFLKKYNICGVILEDLDVYYEEIPFDAKQITVFVSLLKSKIESLKVGLFIEGEQYSLYTNSKNFDFNVANTAIDHFFFDISILNDCTPETRCKSTNPITSDNSNLITIEQVSNAVANSGVDKSKTYALLLVSTTESREDIIANHDGDRFGTFSKLCKDALSGNDTSKICFDSTPTLYNQGKFVRDYFSGIMVSVMETDDYDCSCGCRPFVVANTILDGWECCDLQACETIDKLLI